MKVGAVAINWLLIVHQTLHRLPEPTGTNWFVTSNNLMDWDKFIPFWIVGTFRRSLQWLETTSSTLYKPLGLRQPMPNRARWAGQMVLSKKVDGFSKHPHFAKISSTSVWTKENFKNFLSFNLLITVGERYDGIWGTTVFVCATNSTSNIEEQTWHL